MHTKIISRWLAYGIIAGVLVISAALPGWNTAFAAPPGWKAAPPTAPKSVDPMQPPEMLAWLNSGAYSTWYHEADVHQSAGPHGMVRAYYNQALEDSLKAGDKAHPVGSMAVKEFFTGDAISGWAVLTKGKDTGDPVSQWYFYMTQDKTDPTKFDAADWGVAACATCHKNGQDMILSGYPLPNPVERVDQPKEPAGPPMMMSAVPTDPNELFTWLKHKSYSQWYSNTAIHPSAGPHGNVKAYYNNILAASYKNDKATFPIGVTAVKEIYDDANTLTGWLVISKTKKTDNPSDWFFYWDPVSTDKTQYKVADWGVAACVACHTKGHDMVMSGYPLK